MRKTAILKILTAVVLLGVLIFFSKAGPLLSIRQASLWSLEPFMGMTMSLGRILGMGTSGLGQEEIIKLIRENDRIKTLNFALEELRAENRVLKHALDFKEESHLPIKGARVLFFSREFGKEFLVIDQGEKDGILDGDLVIDSEMVLVGVVRESGKSSAKVEIASNVGETFEGELIPIKARILARGLGARTFSLELIPQDTPIRQGDFVALVSEKQNINFLFGQVASGKTNETAPFKKAGAVLLARPEFLKEVFVVSASR